MDDRLPVIDMRSLFGDDTDARGATAAAIDVACRDHGFFYLVGHGIEPDVFAAVTLIGLARSAADASSNVVMSLAIVAASLLLLYRWKHRLVPLAVVGLGALVGIVGF